MTRGGKSARVTVFGSALACAALLGACVDENERPAAMPAADIKAHLVAQADAWDKAIVRKDRAGIEENIAPEFFHIASDGSMEDKVTFVADLVDPTQTIEPYVVEGLAVHLYGEYTALVTGSIHMTGSANGKPFDTTFRYTDTYIRMQDGRWKVVAVQTTRILPPK